MKCQLCDAPSYLHNSQIPDHHDPGCPKAAPSAPAQDTIAEALARLIEADPHQWSSRPCQTCRAASAILGRPFGCSARAK